MITGLFDVDVDEDGPYIVSYIPERNAMDTSPINDIEKKIQLLCKIRGFKDTDIEFKSSNGFDDEDNRIFKYGYWNYLDAEDMIYIQENAKVTLVPRQWEDEDTGNLVAYEIKPR
tara:strand:+ start:103 stop:447 length:345 start_codon:yes stop_codon:yes gene_type:complete